MCGGSFMSDIGRQVGSALGGGANPLQSIGTGGMGLGGMPAPMQNPFLGGQGVSDAQMNPQRAAPVPNANAWMREMGMPNDPGLTPYKLGQTLGGSSGGGMSQPMPAGWEPKLSSVNTTTTQDIMGRGSSGVPAPQGPGAGISPEMLQKLLQGTPSDANGPYPAQVRALPYGGMGQPQPQVFPAQPRPQVLPKEKPQRPVSPFLQRVAQSMQRQQQQPQQPAQGLGAGISSLINRGMMF